MYSILKGKAFTCSVLRLLNYDAVGEKAASKAIDPSKCEESRDESEWNGIKNRTGSCRLKCVRMKLSLLDSTSRS